MKVVQSENTLLNESSEPNNKKVSTSNNLLNNPIKPEDVDKIEKQIIEKDKIIQIQNNEHELVLDYVNDKEVIVEVSNPEDSK